MSEYVLYRKFNSLGEDSIDGIVVPLDYRPSLMYRNVFKENPNNRNGNPVSQRLGVVDGKIGGGAYIFPTAINCDGEQVKAGSGSDLRVEGWAKKGGLGFELCDFDSCGRDGDHVIFEGGGLSQMAVKVHRFMGFKVFEYPRYIMLLKSRALIEQRFSGWVRNVLCGVIDFAIAQYALMVRLLYSFNNKGSIVEFVSYDDVARLGDVAKFASNGSRFSEVHDSAWFRWVLSCSYSPERKIGLYLVKQRGVAVGFFMFKQRFHKQASHRGFKNVNLGSIIEWGCVTGKEKVLLWNIVNWVTKQRKELDAVEFPVYEQFVQTFLRRLGWRQVGNANFAYNIRPNSGFKAPEGMDNPANWRLRPAMGDAGLS